ncbi:MAG: hypothetical protein Q4A32_00815 [Lachnospiraceae bacterium]|nr:hypothetical protein [Lachnospiraceae bacterium]
MEKTFEEVREGALGEIRFEFETFAMRFEDISGDERDFFTAVDIRKKDLFGAIKFANRFGVISEEEKSGFWEVANAMVDEAIDDYTMLACERIRNRRNDGRQGA